MQPQFTRYFTIKLGSCWTPLSFINSSSNKVPIWETLQNKILWIKDSAIKKKFFIFVLQKIYKRIHIWHGIMAQFNIRFFITLPNVKLPYTHRLFVRKKKNIWHPKTCETIWHLLLLHTCIQFLPLTRNHIQTQTVFTCVCVLLFAVDIYRLINKHKYSNKVFLRLVFRFFNINSHFSNGAWAEQNECKTDGVIPILCISVRRFSLKY